MSMNGKPFASERRYCAGAWDDSATQLTTRLVTHKLSKHVAVNRAPALGLVCMTVSDAVRFRTITRKQLLTYKRSEQKTVLLALYRENLSRL